MNAPTVAPKTTFWSAAALFLFPALAALFLRGPWPLDEARLLQVVTEMEARAAWLVPTLLGEVYTHKPPLILWTVRLLSLAGLELWTASRLLGVLFALGCLFCMGRIARALLPDASCLPAPALAVSPFFLMLGQAGTYDIPLLFFLLASLACLASRPHSWALPAFFLGMAVLTKGHVALFFGVPWLLSLRWTLLGRGVLRPTWRSPAAFLLCLGLVCLWLIPFFHATGLATGKEALLEQLWERLGADAEFGHSRPLHYYLVVLPLLFLPWSWSLLWGLTRPGQPPWRPWEKALLWVGLGQLVVLSLIETKGGHYALPLLPWLLLLLPRALSALGGHGSAPWIWAGPALGLAALVCAAGPFDALLELARPGLPALLSGARLPVALAGIGLCFLPFLRNRIGPLPLLSTAQALLLVALLPVLDRAQLPHAILKELAAHPPRALLVVGERAGGSLAFLAAHAGVAPPDPALLPVLPENTEKAYGFGSPGVAAPSLSLDDRDLRRHHLLRFLRQPGTRALVRRRFFDQMDLGQSTRARIVSRAYFRGRELLLLAGLEP